MCIRDRPAHIAEVIKQMPAPRSFGRYGDKKGGNKGANCWSLITVGTRVSYTLSRNPENGGPVGKDVVVVEVAPDFKIPLVKEEIPFAPAAPAGDRPRRLMLTKKSKPDGNLVTSGEGKQSVGPCPDGDIGFWGPFMRANHWRGYPPNAEEEWNLAEQNELAQDEAVEGHQEQEFQGDLAGNPETCNEMVYTGDGHMHNRADVGYQSADVGYQSMTCEP
eukprot:TRINITY_DN36726_c0_g1_i1.p1 TRINITY_DN36726_c0_g1~~TRINITY_DN36726_c0_g1_i1.p1  ORF type:complete len:219 (+),score=42.13 TRINITY_DN36726_c0_g1_i1:132-788(+)